MTKELVEKLYELHKNLTIAFDINDLEECANALKGILEDARNDARENSEAIGLLEKADAAIFDVICEFEEYEISGLFAAVVGNNSELRSLFKENVQIAISCIAEILRHNM